MRREKSWVYIRTIDTPTKHSSTSQLKHLRLTVGEYGQVNYNTSNMLANCWGVWINIGFPLVFRQLIRNASSRAYWYGLNLKLMWQ